MQKRLVVSVVAIVLVVGALVSGGSWLLQRSAKTPTPEASVIGGDIEAAQAQLDAGEFVAAKATLEQLVAQNDKDAEAHFLLGLACFNLQEYDKARESFNRSLALDPGRGAAVHHNLGVLAYQLGDLTTAVAEFQAALAIDAQDADSHYQLGATYLVLAFPAGALQPDADYLAKSQSEFELALQSAPNKPEALVGLANIHIFQNRVDEAIALLEEALEQSPDMREALFALGRAYAVAGQNAQARETLQRFLDTNPPEVWAQEAQQLLGQLDQ
ncbi:MAG TPA: tetratricopeptide repeat protein [Anaerolineae bacterium]|nr:tetratricopeptide repeat protein [Anaerolineae bacterium]